MGYNPGIVREVRMLVSENTPALYTELPDQTKPNSTLSR